MKLVLILLLALILTGCGHVPTADERWAELVTCADANTGGTCTTERAAYVEAEDRRAQRAADRAPACPSSQVLYCEARGVSRCNKRTIDNRGCDCHCIARADLRQIFQRLF